jgi:hypothetical protein
LVFIGIARALLNAGNATAGRDPRSPACDRGQFSAVAWLPAARKNGGCPHADTVGLFLAFKCEIRMPLRSFEMAHPVSQDYAMQTIEKVHLPGAR